MVEPSTSWAFYIDMSQTSNGQFYSRSNIYIFFCFIVLSRTPRIILNKGGHSSYCLISYLKGYVLNVFDIKCNI